MAIVTTTVANRHSSNPLVGGIRHLIRGLTDQGLVETKGNPHDAAPASAIQRIASSELDPFWKALTEQKMG